MIKSLPGFILTSSVLLGCATAPKIDDTSSTKIDAESTKDFKLKVTESKSSSGLASYKFKGETYKAQWMSCVSNAKAPFVAIFHGRDGFDSATFCRDWTAQVLIQNGFNVVAVNRPSKGQSSGNDDFSGPQSVEASIQGIKAATGNNPVIGFWGYDTGTIAASFAAKSTPGLKWLLLGNGYYDLEIVERSTTSPEVKKLIETQKTLEGDAAIERRSIAWDASGLPSMLMIYHSNNDEIAPKAQAETFNNQLRTMQTKVFFDEINGTGHDLPWQAHFQIVSKALKNLK